MVTSFLATAVTMTLYGFPALRRRSAKDFRLSHLADIYARTIADLITALNAYDTREEAADILRGLIEKIVLTRDTATTQ